MNTGQTESGLIKKLKEASDDEVLVLVAPSDTLYRAMLRIEKLTEAGIVFPSFVGLEKIIGSSIGQLSEKEIEDLVDRNNDIPV